jgi:hypothetical protein
MSTSDTTSEAATSTPDTSTPDTSTPDTPSTQPMPDDPRSQRPKLAEDNPSYVKLAMRNMVKKGAKSLFHFTLSAVGLLGLLVGLAYLTR